MLQVSIAEAKNTSTRFMYEAERGEGVHITRHGKPVAVLVSEDHTSDSKPGSQKKISGRRLRNGGFKPALIGRS